jgi:membrane-bound lytic murein transglycosylase B
MMVKKHNFKQSYLENLFKNVQKEETSLNIITRKRTKKPTKALKKRYPVYGAWDRYVQHKVTPRRIHQGKSFLRKYRTAFKNAEKEFGVPKEYIAAIIGIESVYGKNVGKHHVFDTLATLAFEKNRRNKFFKGELEKFLILSFKNKFNPKNVMGSYTGAIGLGQFMPSNYEYYGVDFNHDGKVSLQNPVDAIGSIANYLKKNGWRRGEKVATRVSFTGNRFRKYKTGYDRKYNRIALKGITPKRPWNYKDKVRLIKLNRAKYDELWYGAKNFYVITRYNHSAYYAMSVHKLAKKLKG